MKIPVLVLLVVLIGVATGCKQKNEPNLVDPDQINVDDSNDYRHIFKDTIQQQEDRMKREKKNDFK
jgi:hypothetical protein